MQPDLKSSLIDIIRTELITNLPELSQALNDQSIRIAIKLVNEFETNIINERNLLNYFAKENARTKQYIHDYTREYFLNHGIFKFLGGK